tara:strand:- start:7991 stop:8581 length:591 start_codon:yes stop_codon:yes gene_type:complete
MRAYKVETAAAVVLITTADAKTFLKVDTTEDDTVIDNLISAATESAQEYTNRFFINTTLVQYGSNFSDLTELLKSPVGDINDIKYYDVKDILRTVSAAAYSLIPAIEPSLLDIDSSEATETDGAVNSDRIDAVQCEYIVGYGTASTDVPSAIIQAVYLTLGHWYQNRTAVVVGRQVNTLPMGAKYLLEQYKVQVCR